MMTIQYNLESPQLFTYDIAKRISYPITYTVYQGTAWFSQNEEKKKKKHQFDLTFLYHDTSKKEVAVRYNNFTWNLHVKDGLYVSGIEDDPIYLISPSANLH